MTTSTLTLADFLLARIAEDEADARPFDPWGGDGAAYDYAFTGHGATHMEMTVDPARVLAECEAKRRIVNWYQDAVVDQGGIDEDSGHAFSAAYDMACRALATPYSDHPDYREEWREL